MALVTGTSSHPLRIGAPMAEPAVAHMNAVPKTVSRYVPKPRAVQRPRALAKAVTKASTVADHYQKRGG